MLDKQRVDKFSIKVVYSLISPEDRNATSLCESLIYQFAQCLNLVPHKTAEKSREDFYFTFEKINKSEPTQFELYIVTNRSTLLSATSIIDLFTISPRTIIRSFQ